MIFEAFLKTGTIHAPNRSGHRASSGNSEKHYYEISRKDSIDDIYEMPYEARN